MEAFKFLNYYFYGILKIMLQLPCSSLDIQALFLCKFKLLLSIYEEKKSILIVFLNLIKDSKYAYFFLYLKILLQNSCETGIKVMKTNSKYSYERYIKKDQLKNNFLSF